MQQSVSLLRVKDPLFKRMGASRLARFAKDGNLQLHYLYLSSRITWNLYLIIYNHILKHFVVYQLFGY
jgi:hypothetical protein